MYFLDNEWWGWILNEVLPRWSITLGLIIGLLKALAVADDRTPTDKILDYLSRLLNLRLNKR